MKKVNVVYINGDRGSFSFVMRINREGDSITLRTAEGLEVILPKHNILSLTIEDQH